jgi:hypothetical protein
MEEMSKSGKVGQAAMKAAMDRKTGRRDIAAGKLPSEMRQPRWWRTRHDPFAEDWPAVAKLLEDVHSLQPVAVPAKLAQALGTGAVFRVPYRSRPGAVETPAFLLAGDAGAFLILAEPHAFEFVGPDQPVLPENGPDEDDIDAFAFPDSFGGNNDPA